MSTSIIRTFFPFRGLPVIVTVNDVTFYRNFQFSLNNCCLLYTSPCEIVSTAIDVTDYLLYHKANTAADNNDNETVIDITMTDCTKGCLLYTSRCV